MCEYPHLWRQSNEVIKWKESFLINVRRRCVQHLAITMLMIATMIKSFPQITANNCKSLQLRTFQTSVAWMDERLQAGNNCKSMRARWFFSLKHDFQCIIERPLLKFGPFQHKGLNWNKKNTWMPLWFILICNFKAAQLKTCNKSETFLRNLGGKFLFSGPTSSFRLGLQNFSVQSTLCPIYIFYASTSVPQGESTSILPQCQRPKN